MEQIRSIYWRNKISPSTINVASGLHVSELQVFEITLSQKGLDEAVLTQIDKEIPYHILFILFFEGEYQAWIGFKEEAASGSNAFKVGRYYHTEWVMEEKLNDILRIEVCRWMLSMRTWSGRSQAGHWEKEMQKVSDWEKLDAEYLPLVKEECRKLYEGDYGTPKR